MKDKCCKIKCEWKYDCNDIWFFSKVIAKIVLITLLLNIESIFGYIAAA